MADGLVVTLKVTFFAVLIGIVFGFLIAMVRATYDKTGKLKILNLVSDILRLSEETYENYFNISRNLVKGGKL